VLYNFVSTSVSQFICFEYLSWHVRSVLSGCCLCKWTIFFLSDRLPVTSANRSGCLSPIETEKAACMTNALTNWLACQTRCLSTSDTSLWHLNLFPIHWRTEWVIDWYLKLPTHESPHLLSEKPRYLYFCYCKPLSTSLVWNDSNEINCRILFLY
jgi:hypothetical protein